MIPGLRKYGNVFSIKVKFTLFTILIGVISFAIAAHFSSQFMAEESENQATALRSLAPDRQTAAPFVSLLAALVGGG